MEAMLIGIPFLIYVYFRIRFGNDKTNFEFDSELFSEGVNLFDSEDYAKAFRYFDTAITSKPKSSFCYFFRGKCHFVFENWEAALNDFEKAIRLENTVGEIFHYKAICLHHLDRYKEARIALKMASRLFLDKNSEILLFLANVEIRLVDFESAKKTLKLASDLGDSNANKLLNQYKISLIDN